MPMRFKLLDRQYTNALSRAVGRSERRVGVLEFDQLAEKPVELCVADLGRLVDVVEPVVPLDFAPQNRRPLRPVHRRDVTRREPTSS